MTQPKEPIGDQISDPDTESSELSLPAPQKEKKPDDISVLGEELASHGFTSTIPFEDKNADCLGIWCSDQRFRRQNIEFIRALGYQHPYVISLPSGVAVAHSMVAAINFLSKAFHRLLAKAVELTDVTDIVCIAHEDCGGYKAGRVKLIGQISRRLTGKSTREIQCAHLAQASRDIALSMDVVNVRAFYANVHTEGKDHHVHYKEVPFQTRRWGSGTRKKG